MKLSINHFRKAVWHYRRGGFAQVRQWEKRAKLDAPGGLLNTVRGKVEREIGLSLPTILQEAGIYSGPKLKVAVILDDFSARAWGPEWDCIYIKPTTWFEELESKDFDLLFVESAWAGNSKSWQYHLTGPTAPRPAFAEMVNAFKANGVPTAFWNKEDPPHFDDFLEAAKLFDFVFTSDERMIPRYKSALGHSRVASLSFAAQPEFHNPVRPISQPRRDIAFAGMYFAHKFPERREQMDIVLGGAVDISPKLRYGLDIFSRQHGGDEKYQFPDPYRAHVVGSLAYDQMLTAYKYYNVFLNVNSVVDSPSMCARRIFEITAAGAAVVSAPSAAISNFFAPSEVIEVHSREEAAHAIRSIVRSPELRDRMVHLGQRRIWNEHTYAHRAKTVTNFVGLNPIAENPLSMAEIPRVSAVVSTIRPQQLDHIFQTVGCQRNVEVQLVLVTHGFSVDNSKLAEKAKTAGITDFVVLELGRDLTLGECLNQAVARCEGDFITKMDDDDLYGEHYLCDQVSALRYSGASVVGKQAHYMYLADSDATLLRFADREHRFTDLVMGPTMLGRADVFKETPFQARSRGEDTNFLRDVADGGGTVYSADRFNFVQMRGNDGRAHTWDVSDAELTATGSIQWFGRNDKHIFF
ncbi:glycosyltransferase [Paeniglutamicibacter sp.]|uniref:glycosyltransferase family protein n=1 Tax=Paeniglutamicibacter sp. TaxID=1934391 RepID=UPI0039891290